MTAVTDSPTSNTKRKIGVQCQQLRLGSLNTGQNAPWERTKGKAVPPGRGECDERVVYISEGYEKESGGEISLRKLLDQKFLNCSHQATDSRNVMIFKFNRNKEIISS